MQNITHNLFVVTTLLISVLVFSGCGGSGSNDTGGNPTDFVALTEFSISPMTISDGQSFTINSKTAFASPSSIYTFEFHITSDASTLSSSTKVFGLNCGNNQLSCIDIVAADCEMNDTESGFPKFTCSLPGSIIETKTISKTGDLFAVGEACIFDANLTRNCDSRSIGIHLS